MSHFWTKSNFTYPPLEDPCSRSLDPPHYYTLSAVLLLELPYTDLLSLHIFQKLWHLVECQTSVSGETLKN